MAPSVGDVAPHGSLEAMNAPNERIPDLPGLFIPGTMVSFLIDLGLEHKEKAGKAEQNLAGQPPSKG
jgi:hypothetical protein